MTPAIGAEDAKRHTQEFHGRSAPRSRQPAQPYGKEQNKNHALPEIRHRKTEDGASHNAPAQPTITVQARDQAHGYADYTGQRNGYNQQFQRSGKTLQYQLDSRHPMNKGIRSEEYRVGKECYRTFRSWWYPFH